MSIIKLLHKTSKAAQKHRDCESAFREAFLKRYGKDFSDIDCDPVIDACSGQGSPPNSVEDLDKAVFQYCKRELANDRSLCGMEE